MHGSLATGQVSSCVPHFHIWLACMPGCSTRRRIAARAARTGVQAAVKVCMMAVSAVSEMTTRPQSEYRMRYLLGARRHSSCSCVCADGTWMWTQISCTPTQAGQPTCACAFTADAIIVKGTGKRRS